MTGLGLLLGGSNLRYAGAVFARSFTAIPWGNHFNLLAGRPATQKILHHY